jgi:hypothetical protein
MMPNGMEGATTGDFAWAATKDLRKEIEHLKGLLAQHLARIENLERQCGIRRQGDPKDPL